MTQIEEALTRLRAGESVGETLSAESLAPRIQRSVSEAQTVLKRMVNAGLIEPAGGCALTRSSQDPALSGLSGADIAIVLDVSPQGSHNC